MDNHGPSLPHGGQLLGPKPRSNGLPQMEHLQIEVSCSDLEMEVNPSTWISSYRLERIPIASIALDIKI